MQDVPRPFELRPPDPAPSRPSHPTRVPVDHEAATQDHHTDLPLPPCGNGGSARRSVHAAEAVTLEQLLDHLDRLLSVPAAPSLAEADRRAVRLWAEEAAAGVVSRTEGLKLVRQVERVLADESRTAIQVSYAKERIEQRLSLAKERAAGTHWRRRDSGRRAKQPTHVDVELAAWRRAKAAATRKGMTVGHYVGILVRSAAEHDLPEVDPYASTSRLFARVDVDKPTWDAFKARCHDQGVSAARGVERSASNRNAQRAPETGT
jgi:hypothetical protein